MKSVLRAAGFLALAVVGVIAAPIADDDSCEADLPVEAGVFVSIPATKLAPANATTVFAPRTRPGINTHNLKYVRPQSNVSFYYATNASVDAHMVVNHTMKYPTVMLEQIASISNVDCSASSVAMTFNNITAFTAAQAAWSGEGSFVLVTNHLGDCDEELERSFFVANSLSFDNKTLVATAEAVKSNVSETAAETEITFGNIPSGTVAKRALVLDPSYTLRPSISLPADTVLYSYSPYITVTAETASFASNVTFSGYLKYSWLLFKLQSLYFDIDAGFTADVAISAEIDSTYNTTFSYAPATLFYGVSVPGILELGPQLQFAVDAEVYASEAVTLTTELQLALADGNVHLDLLDQSKTGTSGWMPTYGASANISGQAEAQLNPTAALTVEIAINFFGGLLDLSTGLTASPGFDNSFILSAAEGVDLGGVQNLTSAGNCKNGLELSSNFTFSVDAFATQWYQTTLYEVEIPILQECFSWA